MKNAAKNLRILARPKMFSCIILLLVTLGVSLYRFFLAELFSEMLNKGSLFSDEEIIKYAVLIVAVLIMSALSTYLLSIFSEKAIQESQKRLQKKLRESLDKGSYSQVEKIEFGQFHTLMTSDTELVSSFYPKVIFPVVGGAVQFILALYFAFENSWEIALIVLGISAFSILIPKLFKNNLKNAKSDVQKNDGFLRNFFTHSLERVDLIKVYESQGIEEKELNNAYDRYGNSLIKQQSVFAKLRSINNLATYASIAVQSFIQIWFISMGRLTIGAFIGLSQLSGSINWPFWCMPILINNISQTEIAADRLGEFINHVSVSKNGRKIQSDKNERLVSKGEKIHFAYDDKMIFKDFSFEIRKNEIIGLTWKSGGGKSTLVKLISGLYSPQKGYIYDKRDVTFSYATQRETFFSDTIENNISLSEKTDELLLETTLNKASMDFKEHSKKTVLMKNGQPLSGGQQKRINLARAFYRDSDILILDEPTASLDLKTKKQVLKAIKEEKKKRAVILITHDPDTSAICDRFLERK